MRVCFFVPSMSPPSQPAAIHASILPSILPSIHMGVSENRGPLYSTLNSRILIIRTPNKERLIFGNSHVVFNCFRWLFIHATGGWADRWKRQTETDRHTVDDPTGIQATDAKMRTENQYLPTIVALSRTVFACKPSTLGRRCPQGALLRPRYLDSSG